MSSVRFDYATRLFPGQDAPAVDALDLDIEDGEFMVLVGPSGCGKSTSLRMLAGLEEVTSGGVYIGDRDVTHVPPKDRDIAMVFQNYALYPHMTVAENMGFALKMQGASKATRMEHVKDAAKLLDLEDFLDRKPKALSGGQRQRVAMGRAIVRQPRVFCMDEPLSNLDAKLRVSTRTQIAALQQRLNITTVYVTHDQVEAMTMGDRVAVLKDGVLQQVGSPLALYDEPANLFVAGFIGSPAMNLISAMADTDGATIGEYVVPISREALAKAEGHELTVGIRPETWRMVADDEPGLPVEVVVVEELGADAYLYGNAGVTDVRPEGVGEEVSDVAAADVVARIDARRPPQKGTTVRLGVDIERVHVFDNESGERLTA